MNRNQTDLRSVSTADLLAEIKRRCELPQRPRLCGNYIPMTVPKRDIVIREDITVKQLADKLDVKANFVVKKLVDRGIFATINQTLDAKLATSIAQEFGASVVSWI